MVISLVASKISLIFAPVIRQVKSGCGRFLFIGIRCRSLKQKFGEYLAAQPFNITEVSHVV